MIAVNREFKAKDPDMWVMASRRVTIESPTGVTVTGGSGMSNRC